MKTTEIMPKDIWNDNKLENINDFIKNHAENQSKERKIKNKLFSIQYQLVNYIWMTYTNDDTVTPKMQWQKI